MARSAGGGTCNVLHSADGGASWAPALSVRDAFCFALHLRGHGGRLIGLLGAGGTRIGTLRLASIDGGRVWNVPLPIPPGDNPSSTDLVVSPGFAEDGGIFIADARGGLWQYGPLPCPVPIGDSFRPVWESEQ